MNLYLCVCVCVCVCVCGCVCVCVCVSGLVKSLHGLNITNNPLEFPPQDVIERGTYEIQKFLREMLQAKSSAKMNVVKDGLYIYLLPYARNCGQMKCYQMSWITLPMHVTC